MNLNDTIQKYLDDISSSSPTPGGGNVAAFSAAAACSLGIMVCNLTIGKKKYADVENEMTEVKARLEDYKEEFLSLAKQDNEAFDKVMDAFKLPKETDEQKMERSAQIEKATLNAAIVPASVVSLCNTALPEVEKAARKGNQNSLSDAGVAASLLNTAAQGAFLNVLINYSSLTNKESAAEIYNSAKNSLAEAKVLSDKISAYIISRLNKV